MPRNCFGVEMPEGYRASVCPVLMRTPVGRHQGWKLFIRMPDNSWHRKTGRVYASEAEVRSVLQEAVEEDEVLGLSKAGPPYPEPPEGPPPGKEDKVWNPMTARWRNPPGGGAKVAPVAGIGAGRNYPKPPWGPPPGDEGKEWDSQTGKWRGLSPTASTAAPEVADGVQPGQPAKGAPAGTRVLVTESTNRDISGKEGILVRPDGRSPDKMGIIEVEGREYPVGWSRLVVAGGESSAASESESASARQVGALSAGGTVEAFQSGEELYHKLERRLSRRSDYLLDYGDNDGLMAYVGDEAYQQINTFMRTGEVTGDMSSTDLTHAIQDINMAMRPLEVVQPLYRGWGGTRKDLFVNAEGQPLQVGDDFISSAFVSTSRNPVSADNFAAPGDVMMEIHPARGMRAITIGDDPDELEIPGANVESETLLDSGTRFKIESIEDVRGYTMMVVRVLGDGEGLGAVQLSKAPKGTPWTEAHGLQFDPQSHRWVQHDRSDIESREAGPGSVEEVVGPRVRSPISKAVGDADALMKFTARSHKAAEKQEQGITQHPAATSLGSRESSLARYTRDLYKPVNRALRDGTLEKDGDLQFVQIAQDMAAEMKPLQDAKPVYRGVQLASPTEWRNEQGNPVQAGDVITLKAFTSCSRSAQVAYEWSGSGVLLEIHPAKDARGMVLNNEDVGYAEFETLLDYGQQVYVEAMYDVPDYEQETLTKVAVLRMLSPEGLAKARMMLAQGPPYEEPPKKPPGKEGKEWNPQTARWRNPSSIEVEAPSERSDSQSDVTSDFGGQPTAASWDRSKAGMLLIPGEGQAWAGDKAAYRDSPDFYGVHLPSQVSRYYDYEYAALNQALRDGEEMEPEDQETYDEMRELMQPMQEDHLVFRSWRRNPEFAHVAEGEEVLSPQFMSTTTDPHYAVKWAGYNTRTKEKYTDNPLWQIRVPKGACGLMAHPLEGEVTLDVGVHLRCVGIIRGQVVSNGPHGSLQARDVYDMEVVVDERVRKMNQSYWGVVEVLGNLNLAGPPYEEPEGGPPPGKEGKEWNSQTARWRNPLTNEGLVGGSEDGASFLEELKTHVYSEVRDKWMQQVKEWEYEQADNFQPLVEAVLHYTIDGYIDISRSVRRGKPNAEATQISTLMRPVGESQVLFRGVDKPFKRWRGAVGKKGAVEIGDELMIDGFMSTSRSMTKGLQFAGNRGVFMEIHAGPETSGMQLANRPGRDEYETVLDYGQCLRVVDVVPMSVAQHSMYQHITAIKCVVVPCGGITNE